MEKIYKQVPFDIELAKKIINGEIDGRIVTVSNEPVRILAFDINNSNPIAAAVTRSNNNEVVYTCKSTGKYIEGNNYPAYDIKIEIAEENIKHNFKPFDKVLVRFDKEDDDVWSVDIFSHYTGKGILYRCMLGTYKEDCIIPYKGNEHLVGTTYNPKKNNNCS